MDQAICKRLHPAGDLEAELTLARYLGRDFRGSDLRAAALGLPLVLDFITLAQAEKSSDFAWESFDVHTYVAVVIEIEDEDRLFLKALLVETMLFFEYLSDLAEVTSAKASEIQGEIAQVLSELWG